MVENRNNVAKRKISSGGAHGNAASKDSHGIIVHAAANVKRKNVSANH